LPLLSAIHSTDPFNLKRKDDWEVTCILEKLCPDQRWKRILQYCLDNRLISRIFRGMDDNLNKKETREPITPDDSHRIAWALGESPFRDLSFERQFRIRKMFGTGEITTFEDYEKALQKELANSLLDEPRKRFGGES